MASHWVYPGSGDPVKLLVYCPRCPAKYEMDPGEQAECEVCHIPLNAPAASP